MFQGSWLVSGLAVGFKRLAVQSLPAYWLVQSVL